MVMQGPTRIVRLRDLVRAALELVADGVILRHAAWVGAPPEEAGELRRRTVKEDKLAVAALARALIVLHAAGTRRGSDVSPAASCRIRLRGLVDSRVNDETAVLEACALFLVDLYRLMTSGGTAPLLDRLVSEWTVVFAARAPGAPPPATRSKYRPPPSLTPPARPRSAASRVLLAGLLPLR